MLLVMKKKFEIFKIFTLILKLRKGLKCKNKGSLIFSDNDFGRNIVIPNYDQDLYTCLYNKVLSSL